MSNIKSLMDRLLIPGTAMQIGSVNKVNHNINSDSNFDWTKYVDSNKNSDVFFLSGVNPVTTARAADKDVLKKNYLIIDFDIRTVEEEFGLSCDDERLLKIAYKIKECLDNSPRFKDYYYIINSGNGIHVGYLGNCINLEDKTAIFSAGVQQILNEIEIVAKHKADHSCINPSRIFRLPGSFNNKNSASPKEVKFLAIQERNSTLLDDILPLGEIALTETARKMIGAPVSFAGGSKDTYSMINAIPTAELVCKFFNTWEFDGKQHFVERGTTKQKACFIAKNGNYLIHGGTDHFSDKQVGYNTFQFVRMMIKKNDHETFEWFKKNFPNNTNDTPLEPIDEPLKTIRLSELYRLELPPPAYLVDKIIPSQGITGLIGDPNVGKTWFALDVVHSVARGENVLKQFPVQQGAVLIIELDDSLSLIKDRLHKMNKDGAAPIYTWYDERPFFITGEKNVDDPLIKRVIEFVKKNHIVLVVIDTFRDMHGLSENESDKIKIILDPLKSIVNECECAILLTHHQKKAGPGQTGQSLVRGSTVIQGMLASTIQLKEISRANQIIEVNHTKNKIGKKIDPFNFKINAFELEDQQFVRLDYEEKVEKTTATANDIRNAVIEYFVENPQPNLPKGKLVKSIAESTGHSQSKIEISLATLKQEKLLMSPSSGKQCNAEVLEFDMDEYGRVTEDLG